MDDFTGLLVYSQCCATKTQGCARLDNIIGHTNSMLFSCPHLGQSLLFELSFSGVFNHTSQDLAVFLARDTTDITFKLNLICPCVEQTNHDVEPPKIKDKLVSPQPSHLSQFKLVITSYLQHFLH
ncbi:Uncharacterized protein HZ326_9448 [Fusarium oxysporum f. sp. albedinis]|nr:Uncharacterized protein HZ326_9448 [Fusarium oxysporum f. sp. albedinis]